MLDKEALGLPKVSFRSFPHSNKPLGIRLIVFQQKVKVLPNPCTFSINEVSVGIATTDILFHLRKEEISQKAIDADTSNSPSPSMTQNNGITKDPMASLVRHILGQRSFYPIFPPPESLADEVNLDVTHYGLLKMDGPAPDVLILPSKLKHFLKVNLILRYHIPRHVLEPEDCDETDNDVGC